MLVQGTSWDGPSVTVNHYRHAGPGRFVDSVKRFCLRWRGDLHLLVVAGHAALVAYRDGRVSEQGTDRKGLLRTIHCSN